MKSFWEGPFHMRFQSHQRTGKTGPASTNGFSDGRVQRPQRVIKLGVLNAY